MPSTYSIKIIISSALLILLIIAGIYIHKTGKPYHVLVFGIHKLFTVAMVVILSVGIINFLKVADLSLFHYLLLGILILALTGLLISGGMMSLDKLQKTMLVIHRVSTAVYLVCYLALGYILLTHTIQLKQ